MRKRGAAHLSRADRQHDPVSPQVMSGKAYGTPCDVFSFAIVIWELMMKRLPYEDLPNLHCNDLMKRICGGMRPFPLPDPDDADLAPLVTLAKACWRPEPSARPPFTEIVERLENLL